MDTDTVLNIEHDTKGILLRKYETVSDSLCGDYAEFYANGKLKTKGQYILIPSEKMVTVTKEDLDSDNMISYEVSEGMIPTKHGLWLKYSEEGKLKDSIKYKNGEIDR